MKIRMVKDTDIYDFEEKVNKTIAELESDDIDSPDYRIKDIKYSCCCKNMATYTAMIIYDEWEM